MNKEWSELNKTMQAQIKKKDTYKMGIDTLFSLRSQLMQTLVSFKEELCREDFNAIPFINADGYHSKTIAYSIWHIFRMPLLQGVQRKEKTVPEEVPGADRGAPPFGPSWPEVLNGRPGADP